MTLPQITPRPGRVTRRRCSAHVGLQLVLDMLVARWRGEVVDVRDPLIDLGRCGTCGAVLLEQEEAGRAAS